jgi:hypothetical protein
VGRLREAVIDLVSTLVRRSVLTEAEGRSLTEKLYDKAS